MTNQTKEQQAVKLAEKHGAYWHAGVVVDGNARYSISVYQLVDMLTERDKQHTEELAQQSDAGKRALEAIDNLDDYARMNVGVNPHGAVKAAREAIASLQAQWEWREAQFVKILEQVREQTRREVLEEAAVAAWNHYMDTCRRKGFPPATQEHWMACDAIRNLK